MNGTLFKLKANHILKYLFPVLLIYSVAVLIPLVMSFVYSLFDDTGTAFIGLQNYAALLKDSVFWISFKNNIILVVFCVVGQVGIAFIVAALLNTKFLKMRSLHRLAIFLPVVLAPVVTGYLWTIIYNYRFGLLNWFIGLFGMEPGLWLDDPEKVIYMVSIPLIWQYIGLYLIIFLAGMQNIPKEISDAAEIDGANWFQKNLYVNIPMLKGVTQVALMLCISGTMKTFDHIFVMTGGGPGTGSLVMAQHAYNNAFLMSKTGYGSAVSIGMMILSATIILVTMKLIGMSDKNV
ncbi:carbohydrate ABC transporter permease [Gracilibacillus salinarum]|uniref:Sugar ABC transporter permease n=1 Tax=Gracilibacillus salinarum TaxID=2932255 RepID=A0ABY4GRW5_9BACI|nr:sugar ABC transporter permease [Gracilibacillus salinarum]UOQ86984.1 sugar ABC transporter permease [Gracilibacillus salinarum]